jgi:hypothetical protein
MKTMIRTMVVGVLFGSAFAVAAQTMPEPQDPAAPEPAGQGDGSREDAKVDRFCLKETGSRIPVSSRVSSSREHRRCTGANGRVYTREDIERTGEVDLADALRRLDPSIH